MHKGSFGNIVIIASFMIKSEPKQPNGTLIITSRTCLCYLFDFYSNTFKIYVITENMTCSLIFRDILYFCDVCKLDENIAAFSYSFSSPCGFANCCL